MSGRYFRLVLIAILLLLRLLPIVHFPVDSQFPAQTERRITLLTLVRFIADMRFDVFDQVVTLREGPIAVGALVGFFSRVGSHVAPHILHFFEPFVAVPIDRIDNLKRFCYLKQERTIAGFDPGRLNPSLNRSVRLRCPRVPASGSAGLPLRR